MGAKQDESKPLSQKEYLKKYLSGESRKKKKKIAPSTIKRTKIIDDDIDLKIMEAPNGDVNIYDLNEDAPQIVAFVDERPKEVRDRERFASSRWKAINADDDNQGTDSSKIIDQKPSTNLQEADKNVSHESKIKSPKKDRKRKHSESKDHSGSKEKLETTLDGRKAGLQDAKNLKLESAEYLRKEKEAFEKIDKNLSGENVAPIIRDRKTGRKRDLKLERLEQREKEKEEEKLKEKYYEWGKGLKQVEDAKEKRASDLHEMSKPLARYADDVDLEKHLKDKERIGDPMLDYIKKKKQKNQNKDDLKPTYTGHGTSNRFGIHPGYRWDGVDRSNGYEKKWFEQQNKKAAAIEEAYLWSVADM